MIRQMTKAERNWFGYMWQMVGAGIPWNVAKTMMIPLDQVKAVEAEARAIRYTRSE